LEHTRLRERFDIDALDPEDPFEIDSASLPHLAKHAPFTAEDVLDAWAFGDPLFYPAADDGPADWLMIARLPETIVLVPLAPPRSGDTGKCRPIGIYEPGQTLTARYEDDSRR
jgi:hypothetical protein